MDQRSDRAIRTSLWPPQMGRNSCTGFPYPALRDRLEWALSQ